MKDMQSSLDSKRGTPLGNWDVASLLYIIAFGVENVVGGLQWNAVNARNEYVH